MKQNQKNRFNGRYNNRPRSVIMRNTVLESSGPCGKLHGTPLQLFEKYQTAAKDALIQNDLILSETCLQYADHYIRLQNIAIANEQGRNTSNCTGQQNQQSVPVQKSDNIEKEDELPNFSLEANLLNSDTISCSSETDKSDRSDDDSLSIQNMDLSIPILTIQENHMSKEEGTRKNSKRSRKTKIQVEQSSET